MGHLEMVIRIMGYQNCVSYEEEHERWLGTSFCTLIALNIKHNITFISPRIYKGSCIANFFEKEKTKKK